MPKYRVTSPDGKTFEVTAPDGATQADVLAYAQQQFAPKGPQYDGSEYGSPLDGMSRTEKVILGADQAMTALGRGVQQFFTSDDSESGKALQSRIDESKRLDALLASDPYTVGGNIAANVAVLAPTAFVPGANTVGGSAIIGALSGAMQPTASGGNVLSQAATGAAFGAAGQAIGKAAPAIVKAVAAPFHRRGRESLTAETLRRFATNADDVARAAGTTSAVPGINYSLAEATQDPGIAILTRGVENLDPAISGPLSQQNMGNIGAARNAINAIGGDDAAMAAAESARDAFGATAYDAPKKAMVELDDQIKTLMDRPSMSAAWERAKKLAAEQGETLIEGADIPAQSVASGLVDRLGRPIVKETEEQTAQYSGKGLHYLKMGMDALLSDPSTGISGVEAGAIKKTRGALVDWLGQNLDGYDAARQGYAAASKPINQMQIGRYLSDKMTPALAEADNAMLARTRAEAYAQALRGGDRTAKLATGFPAAKMADVMDPEQMQTLKGIEEYLARRAFSQEAGRGAGTNTAQNLASGNLMRQIIGPLGLPESWGESVLSQSLRRGIDIFAKPADAAIQRQLAEALRNPQVAADLLRRTSPTQRQQIVKAIYERALTAAPVGIGSYAAQQ